MQKEIIGCWISNFDNRLLSNSKNRSILWIYSRTCWQPAQFRGVRRLPSNRTWIESSGILLSRIPDLATVLFWPRPGPKAMVRNCRQHSIWPTRQVFTCAHIFHSTSIRLWFPDFGALSLKEEKESTIPLYLSGRGKTCHCNKSLHAQHSTLILPCLW